MHDLEQDGCQYQDKRNSMHQHMTVGGQYISNDPEVLEPTVPDAHFQEGLVGPFS